jgi:YfiH family protein
MWLEMIRHTDGPVFYMSPLLREAGVRHAFSTRLGGVSSGPFDSLNLGNPGGAIQDERARIQENYRRLENAAGLGGRERCWLHQVHGPAVLRVSAAAAHDNSAKGDALVTSDARFALSVRVADCCPVLLASDDGTRVAAGHSGWRGTVAGVTAAALRELTTLNAPEERAVPVKNIFAAIGPCIGFDAFEAGTEVLDEFERVFGKDAPVRRRGDGKGHADIREAVRLTLLRAGVLERNIDTTDACTHRDAEEFFSHRREKGITGRMTALIAARQ